MPARSSCLFVFVACVLLGGAASCTQVPELEDTLTDDLRDSAYPALVPLESALASLPLPHDSAEELETSLNARRDRLKSRAGALQAPIIDEKSRKRMSDGVAR